MLFRTPINLNTCSHQYAMTVFDSKRRYENLAITVRVLQIWSFYYTHGQNHSSTRESFRWRSRWCHRRGLLKLPCDQSIAQRKQNKTKHKNHLFAAALLPLRITITILFSAKIWIADIYKHVWMLELSPSFFFFACQLVTAWKMIMLMMTSWTCSMKRTNWRRPLRW